MSQQLFTTLIRKGALALLKLSVDEWDALRNTRNGVSRFSLTFDHDTARSAKKNWLVLIAVSGSQSSNPLFQDENRTELHLGVVVAISTIATLSSRVVFSFTERIIPPSLELLLDRIMDRKVRGAITMLKKRDAKYVGISPKLASNILGTIASIPENRPAISRILARMDIPLHFENARALQQDALRTALKAFGADADAADTVTLGDEETALARLRLREDMVIEHDARSIPGWTLASSYQTGRATFSQGNQLLEVLTANKQPLEKIFGVDLIYLNRTHRALVMLQYKMMEPGERGFFERSSAESSETDEREWLVRIDAQFKAELERMARFDIDFSPNGAFRLHSGAFYFKLVRRYASATTAGIILSLDHLKVLIASGVLDGPRSGLRITYETLGGHYLRGEAFVELVRSGYIGTRDATTNHLESVRRHYEGLQSFLSMRRMEASRRKASAV